MLDPQQGAGDRGAREAPSGAAVYRRTMPGGGYVEVELDAPSSDATSGTAARVCGRVIMERRADPGRRYGHHAPVVVELSGDDRDELVADLFRLACDNAALARSLMPKPTARQQAD